MDGWTDDPAKDAAALKLGVAEHLLTLDEALDVFTSHYDGITREGARTMIDPSYVVRVEFRDGTSHPRPVERRDWGTPCGTTDRKWSR